LNSGTYAGLLKKVLQGEGIHNGAQHSHVVGSRAIHSALREFSAPKEVSATDNDGHFDVLGRLRDLLGYAGYDVWIHSKGAATKCFTRQFQ
jgi:hypothetical protein